MAQAPLSLVATAGEDSLAAWLAGTSARFEPQERALLAEAVQWCRARGAGRTFDGGEAAPEHALATAAILAELQLDHEALAAALLSAAPPADDAARRELRERWGEGVAGLVEGAQRMAQIEALGGAHTADGEQAAQLEGLRKMLLAMVQDMRVVIVTLAGHLQSLRYLVKSADQDARQRCARLALDIFAPLANRLGLWQFKWELEDLAFRIVEPQTYQGIARLLQEKRVERERFIEEAKALLRHELESSGMRAEISGRPKHIYSIYKKMQRKDMDFADLYDVSALRVLVDNVEDCYAVLGVVHDLWTPIPTEFDDYIAKPKANAYRSLHTAVIGPGGRALEVQIRTHEMHRHAELGVAAHWRYKEGGRREGRYDEKVAWLRQVLQWRSEIADAPGLARRFDAALFADVVYVFTPQGRVIDLPAGSTPIDFAYHVHSDLGHRCRGARVDGAIVPLTTPLANGQRVEIVAAKQGGPSRDWLNPQLGFIRSSRARAKVRQWFNAQNQQEALAQGRAALDKLLQRAGLTALNHETLARHCGFDKLDDFLIEVGRGEVGPRQLQVALRELSQPAQAPQEEMLLTKKTRAGAPGSGILIVGVDKLLTVPAKCCKPAPPDPIVGFVTRGRGVTIHRQSCPNVAMLAAERQIAAAWGEHDGGVFAVDVEVEAADRTGLLRDISDVFSREKINVIAANTASREQAARMAFTVEIAELAQLTRVLKLIREVPGVARAWRR